MPDHPLANSDGGCVLLFSGGRDSSIAAIRLSHQFSRLILMTVTTAHLDGIDAVHRRLLELKQLLPDKAEWAHAISANDTMVRIGAVESCLPCHQQYLTIAVSLAVQQGIRNIALGYAGYQSEWLEQTPLAIERLRSVLGELGFKLLLPSADIRSKDEAKEILRAAGLSDLALEQKCLKQQFNDTDLTAKQVAAEIDAWGRQLRTAFTNSPTRIIFKPLVRLKEITREDDLN
jgi:hypothetical protein